MPNRLPRMAVLPFSALMASLLLAGCSHQEKAKLVVAQAKTPVAAAVSVPKPAPALTVETQAQLFVTAFGRGQLKLMKAESGPKGLTAALVAPTGTKIVTPETPSAILWVLPGGHYALQGNLIGVDGKNLTDQYLEKLGVTPVLMGEPLSPPVAVTASAKSASAAPRRPSKPLPATKTTPGASVAIRSVS